MHFNFDQRVELGEALQDARQKAHHVIVRRADAHRADHVRFAQGIEHLAVQLEDPPSVAQQHLAFGGELDLASVTLEQAALQYVFFQPLHLHAHGRLGAIDQFPGPGETALVGDGDKGTQHFRIDARVTRQLINLRDVLHKKHSLD